MNSNIEPAFSGAFKSGTRDAWGATVAILIASHIGFGATVRALDFPLWLAVFSTLVMWALPGQLVLVESWAVGAGWLAIVPAVTLSAVRFLPMTMTLMPWLRERQRGALGYYLASHLISMTTWAMAMRRSPQLAPGARLAHFLGFALTCWSVSMAAIVAGYFIAATMAPAMRLGIVFLTPVYFLLVLMGETRTRHARTAMACGAIAGPLVHLATPLWGVLLAGLIGGTLAFYLLRLTGRTRDV